MDQTYLQNFNWWFLKCVTFKDELIVIGKSRRISFYKIQSLTTGKIGFMLLLENDLQNLFNHPNNSFRKEGRILVKKFYLKRLGQCAS